MQISIYSKDLKEWRGNTLILGVLEGNIDSLLKILQQSNYIEGIGEEIKEKSFKGKKGEIKKLQIYEKNEIRTIIVLGLGKAEELKLEGIRNSIAIGSRATIGETGTLGIIFPWDAFDAYSIAKAIGESIRLSIFRDSRFKSDPEIQKFPDKIELIGLDIKANQSIEETKPICSGVELARELVNAPPNNLTPEELANQAILIAQKFGLKSQILEQSDCEAKGMGAYLAVAKGSDLPPKFIHLTYSPSDTVKRRVVLIGKGLTFDSGGYNLKVGASQIEKMKYDMGGSAAVLGTARAIAELKPKGIEIHFVVAACENMVNGSAFHPGDVVTASNGKTIEINNTDAEGRLTLADALVYANELKPDTIIDLATLTGACVIALGDEIAGFWTDNDDLAEEIKNAAESCGEGIWRMPMHNPYKSGLKSKIADLQNTGPRGGGSITAALFLKEFVEKSIPWAHIDIAGTCWTEKDRGLNTAGATGYGVRTLVNLLSKES